jgi:hypothetical protein
MHASASCFACYLFSAVFTLLICYKRGEIRMKGGERENTAVVQVTRTQRSKLH